MNYIVEVIILKIIESITGAGFGNVIRCRAQIATGRPPTTHRRIQANTFTHFQTHIQTHFQTHRHKHSHPHTHTSYGSHAHILNSHTNRQTNEHTHTKPRKLNEYIHIYIYISIYRLVKNLWDTGNIYHFQCQHNPGLTQGEQRNTDKHKHNPRSTPLNSEVQIETPTQYIFNHPAMFLVSSLIG